MNNRESCKVQNRIFILITLVILTNFLEIVNPNGNENIIFKVIYMFHIPALIFFAGYMAQYNRKRILGDLVYPYIMFQVIYMIIEKYWINEGNTNPLIVQFTTPKGNLWYLLVIIFCNLLIPLIDTKRAERKVLLLLASGLVSLIISCDIFVGDNLVITRFLTFLPFFILGYYLGQDEGWKETFIRIGRKIEIKVSLLIGVLLSIFYIWASPVFPSRFLQWNLSYAVMGYGFATKATFMVFTATWIAFLCVVLPSCNKRIPLVSTIGKNIWSVYLLHGLVLKVLVKNGLLSRVGPKSYVFVLVFTLLCLVLFGNPIVGKVYEWVFTGKWLFILIERIKNIPGNKKLSKIWEKLVSDCSVRLSWRQRAFYGIAAILFVLSFLVFSIFSYMINVSDSKQGVYQSHHSSAKLSSN